MIRRLHQGQPTYPLGTLLAGAVVKALIFTGILFPAWMVL